MSCEGRNDLEVGRQASPGFGRQIKPEADPFMTGQSWGARQTLAAPNISLSVFLLSFDPGGTNNSFVASDLRLEQCSKFVRAIADRNHSKFSKSLQDCRLLQREQYGLVKFLYDIGVDILWRDQRKPCADIEIS